MKKVNSEGVSECDRCIGSKDAAITRREDRDGEGGFGASIRSHGRRRAQKIDSALLHFFQPIVGGNGPCHHG